MRRDLKHWESYPTESQFPALYDRADSIFTVQRSLARIGDPIPENDVPGYPAGLSSIEELKASKIKTGDERFTLLLVITLFKKRENGELQLCDGRNIHFPNFLPVQLIFCLKQTSMQYRSKSTGSIVERIELDLSVVCAVIKEKKKAI